MSGEYLAHGIYKGDLLVVQLFNDGIPRWRWIARGNSVSFIDWGVEFPALWLVMRAAKIEGNVLTLEHPHGIYNIPIKGHSEYSDEQWEQPGFVSHYQGSGNPGDRAKHPVRFYISSVRDYDSLVHFRTQPKKSNIIAPCQCNMDVLMTQGCQCGGK